MLPSLWTTVQVRVSVPPQFGMLVRHRLAECIGDLKSTAVRCFLKTFIDIMLFSLLFYVFTFLFYTCIVFDSPLFYHV